MTASLPMYNRPELRVAHEEFWSHVRDGLHARGIDCPHHLDDAGIGIEYWKNPALVFSQTCGMPYRKYLHADVTLVGTADFGVQGCPPGYYCSCYVVRKTDEREGLGAFARGRFAFNELDSQSGYAAAWNHLKPQGIWFETVFETGAHLASARAVAQGNADIAALDAVTWRLAQKYDGFAEDLRVLSTTEPTPGLPYITAKTRDADAVFEAVQEALHATTQLNLDILGLKGLVRISKEDYLRVPTPQVCV